MTTMRKTQHTEIEILPGDTLIVVTRGNSKKSILAGLVDQLRMIYNNAEDMQQRTYIHALGHLVGIADVEAVARANKMAKEKDLPSITTKDFRLWLPRVLSEFFGEVIK